MMDMDDMYHRFGIKLGPMKTQIRSKIQSEYTRPFTMFVFRPFNSLFYRMPRNINL